MAIEIIPKEKTKKISWQNIVAGILIAIGVVLMASYFGLSFYQKKLNNKLADVTKKLERTPSESSLEKEISVYQEKIRDFGSLLNAHQYTTNLFTFLEKLTHPRIWFSTFGFSSDKNVPDKNVPDKNVLVDISGQADNFEDLGRQALIFEKQEFIKNVKLSDVSVGREGKMEFEFQLTIDPQILK